MEDNKFSAVLTDLKKPFIEQVEKRALKDGEVLVKVHSAPVHPADQAFCIGYYGNKEQIGDLPTGCGFEGAGEVIETGPNVDESLKGKRVAFVQEIGSTGYQGSYRQYIYIDAKSAVQFPDDVDYDTISCMYGNPFTICGFLDYCEKNNHTSIINDAACSALGKILVKACKKYNIHLINLIRKAEHVDELKSLGADVVLNYSTDEFPEQLDEIIKEHKPTAYFTAVAGELASYILGKMPNHSALIVYGALSLEKISYDPGDFIFKSHKIDNFWLNVWGQNISEEEKNKWGQVVHEDIAQGGDIFGTKIGKKFKLAEVEEAMTYARKHGSEGKVILRLQE